MEKDSSLDPTNAPKSLNPPRIKGRILKGPLILFTVVVLAVMSFLITEIYRADARKRESKGGTAVSDPVVTHEEPLKSSAVPEQIFRDSANLYNRKEGLKHLSERKEPDFEVGQYVYNDNGVAKVSYAPPGQEEANADLFSGHSKEQEERLKRFKVALKSPMEIGGGDNQYAAMQTPMYNRPTQPSGLVGDGSAANLMANLAKKEDQNKQERKETYSKTSDTTGYLQYRKQKPLSPYQISKGWTIPAVLTTGINTDLPGVIRAQVSQNVYDTATGEHLLIPQGSVVVGDYDHFVALGQRRAMLAWRELIFPDGSNINLVNMAGQDRAGYAGLEDIVNNHYLRTFGSALLMSLIGAGFQLSQPPSKSALDPRSIFTAEIGRNGSQVANEIIRQNIKRQPQLKIRPGKRVMITVNRHMVLEPIN